MGFSLCRYAFVEKQTHKLSAKAQGLKPIFVGLHGPSEVLP